MKPKEGMRLLKSAGFAVVKTLGHSECWKNGEVELWISKSTSGSSTLSIKTIGEIRSAIRASENSSSVRQVFKAHQAAVGVRVKSLVDFFELPAGSEGAIDEDYGTGVFIKWDCGLRDGFDKKTELRFLEKI